MHSVTLDLRTKMKLNNIKTLFIYVVTSGSVGRSRAMRLLFISQLLLSFRHLMDRQTMSAATAARSSQTFLATETPEVNI